MTNKPMLSVERELLELVTDNKYIDKERICIRRWEALCKLRAILSKPAAQHQGEPVAYRIGVNGEWFYGDKLSCIRERVEYESTFTKEDFEEAGVVSPEPLYAEQPAPVAVVLPDAEILDRFPEINFGNYGQDEVEALQAWAFEAYEAIEKINGLKPSQDKEGN